MLFSKFGFLNHVVLKTYISILRGINVGGRTIVMADLKAMYEGLGFEQITTYIQSGNVIFRSDTKLTATQLAGQITKAIEKQFGFVVPVIIRSTGEIKELISINPFPKVKGISLDRLHVTFLAEKPLDADVSAISGNSDYSPDEFVVMGKEVFIHCPVSYGETKLSNSFFEKKLKVSATTRNWKTVNKLFELSETI